MTFRPLWGRDAASRCEQATVRSRVAHSHCSRPRFIRIGPLSREHLSVGKKTCQTRANQHSRWTLHCKHARSRFLGKKRATNGSGPISVGRKLTLGWWPCRPAGISQSHSPETLTSVNRDCHQRPPLWETRKVVHCVVLLTNEVCPPRADFAFDSTGCVGCGRQTGHAGLLRS